jgi:hypothetical protein
MGVKMDEKWPKIQQIPLPYTTNEERETYIEQLSGNCWWIKSYLDNTFPYAR